MSPEINLSHIGEQYEYNCLNDNKLCKHDAEHDKNDDDDEHCTPNPAEHEGVIEIFDKYLMYEHL